MTIPTSTVGHIVSVSGGADSATVLGAAHRKHLAEVAEGFDSHLKVFHCNYGQRTERKELECFNSLCDHYSIPDEDRYTIDFGFLKQIGGSCLTDHKIEVDKTGEFLKKKGIPKSYVPGRNIILLSMCSSLAAIHRSSDIWIGVVEEDSSGYPDCRASFIESMNAAINSGLPDGIDIKINTPLIHMQKSEIIKAGLEIGVPYEKTWSCYENNDVACIECDSCKLRIKSFVKLGIADMINYGKPWEEVRKQYESWGIDS